MSDKHVIVKEQEVLVVQPEQPKPVEDTLYNFRVQAEAIRDRASRLKATR